MPYRLALALSITLLACVPASSRPAATPRESLAAAAPWLNGTAPGPPRLDGRPVLVEFWTFG